MANKKAAPTRAAGASEEAVNVVNPAGVVHRVSVSEARELLRDPRFRIATAEEVAALDAAGGLQGDGWTAGTPWEPVEIKENQ